MGSDIYAIRVEFLAEVGLTSEDMPSFNEKSANLYL